MDCAALVSRSNSVAAFISDNSKKILGSDSGTRRMRMSTSRASSSRSITLDKLGCKGFVYWIRLACLNKPTGTVRKKHRGKYQDERREALKCQWKPPCSLRLAIPRSTYVLCPIIQPKCNHDTQSNSKLLQGDKAATEIRGRDLADIKRDYHG